MNEKYFILEIIGRYHCDFLAFCSQFMHEIEAFVAYDILHISGSAGFVIYDE